MRSTPQPGSEPVLTGVTIGTRMTAGPILTNPGRSPTFHRSFWRLRGQRRTQLPLDVRPQRNARSAARIIHDFNAVPREILRWYTGSACRRARRTRLSAPLLAGPLRRQVGGLVIVLASGPLAGLPHLAHREQPSHARTRFRKLFGERRDIDDIVPETENRHTAPPFRETCSSV